MAKLRTDESIVDYLKSTGQDSSFSARKALAESMGITSYTGSGPQNTQMLNSLKNNSSSSNTAKNTPKETPKATETVIETKADTKEEKKSDAPLLGVSAEQWAEKDNPFEASKDSSKADKDSKDALSNLKDITSEEDIISDSVMDAINKQFVVPEAVKEADAYLADQLQKIQSGKTSYSDQVKEMVDKIMNREKFSYDVDTDPLFQQALASAMNSGKQAMQDTIGQASALTGGYGSSYATTAGNQAYNAFIEDAYDNLPQYYEMALQAYQLEGEEMYRQFGMVSELDDKEFNRNVTAYDATSQYRNRVYDEAYNMHRDSVNDAFAMANLQLSEHGQRVSDAYNYYSASSDYSDKLYEREYTEWADSINMVWKEIEALNTEAWGNKNFDESVRQYEGNQAFQAEENQKQRDWQSAEAEKERAFTASENAKNRAASRSGGGGGGGLVYDYTAEEMQKASNSKGVKTFKASILTEREFARRGKSATINGKNARFDSYNEYIDAVLGDWSNDKKLTESETAYLVGYYFG